MHYEKISQSYAMELLLKSNTILVDARDEEDHKLGYIENAVNIPLSEIYYTDLLPSDKDTTIIVYCTSGNRSTIFSKILISEGFTDVKDLGSVSNWTNPLQK